MNTMKDYSSVPDFNGIKDFLMEAELNAESVRVLAKVDGSTVRKWLNGTSKIPWSVWLLLNIFFNKDDDFQKWKDEWVETIPKNNKKYAAKMIRQLQAKVAQLESKNIGSKFDIF